MARRHHRGGWHGQAHRGPGHSYGQDHDYARSGSYPGSRDYQADEYIHGGHAYERPGSGGGSGPGYGGSSGADVGILGNRGFWDSASAERASWDVHEGVQRRDGGDHRGKGPRNYVRSDERIREDLSDRLSDDGQLDASGIEITVAGGDVTLTGTTATRAARSRAEDLAFAVLGVRHVRNDIRVGTR